jgi:protein ImuB
VCEHVFVHVIVAVLLPRFALSVAAGGREELMGQPAALAPEPGREAMIGEVSPAAEAFGVHPGMRLGEAMARCPSIALVPPDPAGVAEAWDGLIARLEGIGAAVATERAGLACFDARGLRGIHGGNVEGVVNATRRALRAAPRGTATGGAATGGAAAGGAATGGAGTGGAAAHGATASPSFAVRLGVAPTPFCAMAAATRARPRSGERRLAAIVSGGEAEARRYVAPLSVDLLRLRPRTAELPPVLERLGIVTFAALAKLPRAKVADRFGKAGLHAHDLAHGRDEPLRPRRAGERLQVSLDLPEAASGMQLARALELLIDRLLARGERRGRSLRAVVISAKLVEGGTWRERVVFREALADPLRMRLALTQKLGLLPAPAESLRLAADRFGPAGTDQRHLLEDAKVVRGTRLREAVRQARAAAGADAALRVLMVDPDSRVPERRAVLAPFEG